MTLIINPPVGAIPVYPWMIAQDFYVSIVEAIRDSQALLDPSFDFEVSKNRLQPYIEDDSKDMLVNLMIGNRQDENVTMHGKDVRITYAFEFLVRTRDDNTYKAGPKVVEMGQYLAAMIEEGVTALYNNVDPVIDVGAMQPMGFTVVMAKPEDVRQTSSLFMFGSANLEVRFGIEYGDWTDLPKLQEYIASIDGNDYLFTPNP